MSGARTGQRGFTFVELAIVLVVGAGCVAVAARLYSSVDDVSDASRHRMALSEQLYDAHVRVGDALRNASLGTVTNLDSTGIQHAPRFQVVEGMTDGEVVLGDEHEIVYLRTFLDFEGMGPVGRLVLRPVGSADGEVLVTHVVEGSWVVSADARVLTLRLGVVATFGTEAPLALTSTSTVFLENP